MRKLETLSNSGLDACLIIEAVDERGPGGANHIYQIRGVEGPLDNHPIPTHAIKFQKGPLQDSGANGISNEALLCIVKDRLEGFQSGQYACNENAAALFHVDAALKNLSLRTQKRIDRGVEGTHVV